MEIVISNSSDSPIYEQIASQIRDQVITGVLAAGEQLPSIRSLATDLRVSAITTKRAYQELEAEGCIETVPGKGCFVAEGRVEMLRETRLRAIENSFSRALDEARMLGLSREELHEMLDLMSEDDGR
ncbi:MAG: GntR family transcriptional regulator [Atopobiaceae bacterium]|nr:GntR family transcriptional regulator [Atopobiaceae bacterium]